MDIREELAHKLCDIEFGGSYPDNWYAISNNYKTQFFGVADFILSKDTLELLKPLYGVDEHKVYKTLYHHQSDKKLTILENHTQALFDGDVVGVKNK